MWLWKSLTLRENTLRSQWRVVCCMEGISTLLSTGFALTSKMVGANVILLSANMSKVFLLLCIVWTFIRGVARRFLSSNARGEPEEQAQVSGSCSSANCRCDSQSTTEYPQRNQGMFKQIQTDFVTCLSSCGVGVSFGVCQAEDEAAAVKNWIDLFRYHESSQMSSLVETFVSKASALQRQGRAGRVRNGFCFRLYPQYRFGPQLFINLYIIITYWPLYFGSQSVNLPMVWLFYSYFIVISICFTFRFYSFMDYSIPEILRVPLEELCLHIMVYSSHNCELRSL